MTESRWLSGVLAATALSCTTVRRERPEMDGRAWASADRTTYVYEHRDVLLSRRGEGKRLFAVGSECLPERPDLVFLSGDGRRAVALGWRSSGGGWHEHSEHEIVVACVLDLVTGEMRRLGDVYPDYPIGDGPVDAGNPLIGARTGWIYRREIPGEHHDVYDEQGRRSGVMAIRLGDDSCDVAERADAVIVACARWRETSAAGEPDRATTYRYWIDIAELDSSVFPPALRSSAEIEVKRAQKVRLSRDGNRLAWFYEGVGGIVDVPSRREIMPLAGIRLWDADFNADGSQLAVLETRDHAGVVRRITVGANPVEAERQMVDFDVASIYWMTDGGILVGGYGQSTLIPPSR